jgi:hypothetical protein
LKSAIVFFLLLFFCLTSFGQGEIDTQEKLLFQNEKSIALNLNSNGFGAGFRFGKRLTYLNKRLFDIEFAYIKHPREIKVASPLYYIYSSGEYTSQKYVNGKTNVFVNLRPSIGFQRELYSKEDKGSIAIKLYYGVGPSIGLTKPIYYVFVASKTNDVGSPVEYPIRKYEFTQDATYAYKEILGRSNFMKGIDEIKVYPGLHAQLGLSFEYSSTNKLINALDISTTFDAFGKKIPIMYTEYNSQFYLTLTISYRFGWVVETRYKTPKITREGKQASK